MRALAFTELHRFLLRLFREHFLRAGITKFRFAFLAVDNIKGFIDFIFGFAFSAVVSLNFEEGVLFIF